MADSYAGEPIFVELGTYKEISGFDPSSISCVAPQWSESTTSVFCSAYSSIEGSTQITIVVRESDDTASVLIRTGEILLLSDGAFYEVQDFETIQVTKSGDLLGETTLKRAGFPPQKAVWKLDSENSIDPANLEVLAIESQVLQVGDNQDVDIVEIQAVRYLDKYINILGKFSESGQLNQSIFIKVDDGQAFWYPRDFDVGDRLNLADFGPVFYDKSTDSSLELGYGWPPGNRTLELGTGYFPSPLLVVPWTQSYDRDAQLPRLLPTNSSTAEIVDVFIPQPTRTWQWHWERIPVPRNLELKHINGRTLNLDCIDWREASINHLVGNSFLIRGSPCLDATSAQGEAWIYFNGIDFKPLIAQFDVLELPGYSGPFEVEGVSFHIQTDGGLYIAARINSVFPFDTEVVFVDICEPNTSWIDADSPFDFIERQAIDQGDSFVLQILESNERCLQRDYIFGDAFQLR